MLSIPISKNYQFTSCVFSEEPCCVKNKGIRAQLNALPGYLCLQENKTPLSLCPLPHLAWHTRPSKLLYFSLFLLETLHSSQVELMAAPHTWPLPSLSGASTHVDGAAWHPGSTNAPRPTPLTLPNTPSWKRSSACGTPGAPSCEELSLWTLGVSLIGEPP